MDVQSGQFSEIILEEIFSGGFGLHIVNASLKEQNLSSNFSVNFIKLHHSKLLYTFDTKLFYSS